LTKNNLTSHQRVIAFSALGTYIRNESSDLEHLIQEASSHNSWFTPTYIRTALQAIGHNLTLEGLSNWIKPFIPAIDEPTNKVLGLVLAGNIPLVGFHDILSALISGFKVQIKLSSDDKIIIPHLLNKLIGIEPAFDAHISYTERIKNFDSIIATGSNNTSRYFEYYFKHVPHVIRKNRNSVAVIHGDESQSDLAQLGHDLFDYFGLGCRNVSKIYFPKDYPFNKFFEAIEPFNDIINHHKYNNNYDYNKSIYLVNGEKHLDNGFLLLKEDTRIASPLAVAYYENYHNLDVLIEDLNKQEEQIQCVVSNKQLSTLAPCFPLGQSQQPALDDYADRVNTLEFLTRNK